MIVCKPFIHAALRDCYFVLDKFPELCYFTIKIQIQTAGETAGGREMRHKKMIVGLIYKAKKGIFMMMVINDIIVTRQ